MNKIKYILSTIFGFLIMAGVVYAATLPVFQGGTGNGNITYPFNSVISSNSAGTSLVSTSTAPLYLGSLTATSSLQSSKFLNNWVGISTSTPRYALQIASSTKSQFQLQGTDTDIGTAFRSVGGFFYIASTSPLTFATTSITSLLSFDLNNGWVGIGTSTPHWKFQVSTTSGPQIALSSDDTSFIWTMRGTSGSYYIATASPSTFATSTGAAFQITSSGTTTVQALSILGGASGTTTSTVGFSISTGCYAIGTTCISGGGGGSGTVTNIATGINVKGGPITTTGTITANSSATLVVSTTTTSGDYTDLQSAINALPSTGGMIHVTCGTYTMAASTTVRVSNTVIQGEGPCTQFNVNAPTIFTAIGFGSNTGLTGDIVENIYLHQTSATFAGIGIDASNTPLVIIRDVKMDGFATSTRIKDTNNQSFYQRFENLDLRDNTTCVEINGNPVNDNTFINIRCGPHSGNAGYGLYIDTSGTLTLNGSQNNTFINFDVEPTGAATGIKAIFASSSVDSVFINPYVEGNATGWNFGSNSQRNQIIGGEFVSNTTYVNNGSNNSWTTTDKEGLMYSALTASSTYSDVSGNDASVPTLSFTGNTGFAKVAPVLKIQLSNSTDQGPAIQVNNPGTGAIFAATTTTASATSDFVIQSNAKTSIGTSTVNTVPGKVTIASTTTSQITLQGVTGVFPVNIRGIGGAFYISTSSATTQSTTTLPALGFNQNGTIIFGDYADCTGTGNFLGVTTKLVTCDAIASDQRLKTQITPVTHGLDVVLAVQPKSWFWIDNNLPGLMTGDKSIQYGLIAQDLQKVAPELVTKIAPSYLTPDGTLTYNHDATVQILWNAVRELAVTRGVRQTNQDDMKIYVLGTLFLIYIVYNEIDKRKK